MFHPTITKYVDSSRSALSHTYGSRAIDMSGTLDVNVDTKDFLQNVVVDRRRLRMRRDQKKKVGMTTWDE